MDRRHFLQATLAAGAASALPTAFAADPLKVAVMIPQSGPGGLFGPSCKACAEMAAVASVSYTHLTLPTNREV